MRKFSLVILAICLILVSACGLLPAKQESEASPEQKIASESTKDTLDEKTVETIAQRIERLNITDIQADIAMQLDMISDNLKLNIKSDSNLEYSASNNNLHYVVEAIVNDKPDNLNQLDIYSDGDYIYLKTNFEPKWIKLTNQNQTIDPDSLIGLYTATEFLNFYNRWKDYIEVTESDSQYTVTLTGSGEQFSDYVRQMMNVLQGLRVDESLIDIYRIKDLKVVHSFDKASNLPTSLTIDMNYLFRGESMNVEHLIHLDVVYRAVNQGFVLELPEEFKTLEVETP